MGNNKKLRTQNEGLIMKEDDDTEMQQRPSRHLPFLSSISRTRCSATEIRPGLWLGSGSDAEWLDKLKSKSISCILNVADDVPNFHEAEGIFEYCNLNVTDFGRDVGISRVFDVAFQFLNQAKDGGKSVLVHCAAGANRSATIVIAWLMISEHWTLAHAWAHVKGVRAGVCPQRDNVRELMAFERQLRPEGPGSFDTEHDFYTQTISTTVSGARDGPEEGEGVMAPHNS